MPRLPLLCALAFAAACAGREGPMPPADGGPAPSADGGVAGAPSVTGIDPDFGPVEGGTPVTITGENFAPDALVSIGGIFADAVVVVSSTTITARTPPAGDPGIVNVRVINVDGKFGDLIGGFEYEAPPPLTIGWCNFQSPSDLTIAPHEPAQVRGRVFVAERTPGPGRGQGVRVQAGYGFAEIAPPDWTWLPAIYVADVDGLSPGDLANDEYVAEFSVPISGTFRLAFRVSGDGGQSWTYCDLDGAANGFSLDATARLSVHPRTIGFCNLQHPAAAVAEPGQATEPFFGRVYAEAVTPGSGQGAGLRGAVGYGPPGEPPTSESWTWVEASYNIDVPGRDPDVLANDEYVASLVAGATGTYDVAFRFTLDDGATWTYCDRDGSDNGYSSAQAAMLVVTPPTSGVDWCRFEGPAELDVLLGDATPVLRGQVFEAGITDSTGRGDGIRGQVGFGPPTAAVNGLAWTWSEAGYLGDADGLDPGALANDEYGAALTVSLPGTYALAYRFSADGGQSWTYCDRDGLANGFDLSQAGTLRVNARSVGYCEINRPLAPPQLVSGETIPPFYGRVFVSGRTPGAGRGADVHGQVGYGTGADPATWTWKDATYAADVDSPFGADLANDEYQATFAVATPGSYRVAFRFSVDGAQTWQLCDKDGGEFEVADAVPLTIVAPTIGYCELTAPPDAQATRGVTTGVITGRVFVATRTPGAGKGEGIRGQLGYGPAAAAPNTWTTWSEAVYARDVDGLSADDLANDEYEGTLLVNESGTYATAYRFSVDGGSSWAYCGQMGMLTVTPPPPTIADCRLESPTALVIHEATPTPTLAARVNVPDVTNAPGQGAGVSGEVGWGPLGSDPAAAGWTWTAAAYFGDADIGGISADEYHGTFSAPTRGEYDFAFRFSVNGGQSWTVCNPIGDLSTRKTITWCNLQFPKTISTSPGATHTAYGQVRVEGVTDGEGQGPDIEVEFGYGPTTDPAVDDSGWFWSAASYNAAGGSGEFDEYLADFVAPGMGNYRYTFRYSTDDGQTWSCYGKTFPEAEYGALSVGP